MRPLLLLFVLGSFCDVSAQDNLWLKSQVPDLSYDHSYFYVRVPGSHFNKTYILNDKGESIMSTYTHYLNFVPNQNPVVVVGSTNDFFNRVDSYNPYGAQNLQQALFLGTVNSIMKIFRKQHQPRFNRIRRY